MIKILYTLLIISSCYIEKTSALTFDFGLTLASSNSEQDAGVGFNLDLIFGKKGSQFVIGTTKALQKNKQDDLYRSTEMLDLNFRLNNISAGLFYGGVVSNVEDFLSSWNFNRIEYQYGYSFEIFFNVNQSIRNVDELIKNNFSYSWLRIGNDSLCDHRNSNE